MARGTPVPQALRIGPFRLQDARQAGLTWKQLQGRSFQRLGHDSYAWAALDADPMLRLQAVRDRMPADAVF